MAKGKSVWILLGFLVISVWVLASTIEAGAESLKIKVAGYVTKFEIVQIEDTERHVIIASSNRGLAFFDNGDVATYANWGTADSINRKSSINGYTKFSFEDGSTIFYRLKGIWEPTPKGSAIGKGTGEFIKGTGKYEGIKGDLTWSSKRYTNYSKEKGTLGDFVLEITATYTLPQK